MSKGGSNHIFTFLAGAFVGAALGILYAPDKGKNTRDRLNFLLDKYSDQLKEMINDLIDAQEETVSEAKNEGERIISDAIKEAERLKNEVDSLRQRISEKKG